MSFLVPVFLAGLAALAVPVILHLMQRPIPRRVVFPTIRYILKGQQNQAGRKGLRDLLTLLARLLVLACIVLIFAGPFLLGKASGVTATGKARVLLFADLSASLSASDYRAYAEAAFDKVRRAYPDAEMALIASSNHLDQTVPFTADTASVRKALLALRPRPVRGDHREARQRLRDLLTQSPAPVHVVILSDLQKQDWDDFHPGTLPNLAGPVEAERPWKTPPGNLAVLSVTPEVFANGADKELRATVLVRNYSLETGRGMLQVRAGPQHVSRAVELAPEASAKFVLDLPNPGSNIGVAELQADEPYKLDNTCHFWLGRRPPPKVAIVLDHQDHGKLVEGFFVKQALMTNAPGADPIELSIAKPEFIMDADLRPYDLLIFLDAMGDYSMIEFDILLGYLEDGGNVLYTCGTRTAETFLSMNRSKVVDTRFIGFQGDLNQMQTFFISSYDGRSPIMAPFAKQPADLLNIPLYRVAKFKPAADATVPMQIDADVPFLVEEPVGKGRFFILATALSPSWSELPTSMSFLPLMRQIATVGIGSGNRRLARLELGSDAGPVLEKVGLPASTQVEATPGVQVVDGIPIEINVTRAESDLRAAEGLAALSPVGLSAGERTTVAAAASDDHRRRTPLRPILGWALLGLLCLELLAANHRIS